jgi:hypothetical protein
VQPYAVSGAVTLLALLEDHVDALSTGEPNPKKRLKPASKDTLIDHLAFRVLLHTRVRHLPTVV